MIEKCSFNKNYASIELNIKQRQHVEANSTTLAFANATVSHTSPLVIKRSPQNPKGCT